MTDRVPVVDIAPYFAGSDAARRAVVRAVDDALRSIGFMVVVGHGLDAGVIGRTREVALRFFDLPHEHKMRLRSTAAGSPRGYVPMGESVLALTAGARTPPDWKEGYSLGPLVLPAIEGEGAKFYAQNRWPDEPADFAPTVAACYREMEALADRVQRIFASALGLPEAYFEPMYAGHNSTMRLIHYPPQREAPLPGQLRAGAHTDFSAFTLLLPQNVSGGLEVQTRDGEWIVLQTPDDGCVVNVGDLLMRWTNDLWVSTWHRVGNPAPGQGGAARRLSIAYFASPRDDALIECLPGCSSDERPVRHAPVLAGEHRVMKIRAAAGKGPVTPP